ncbi:MAG: class I SAM-dependent rRNA methyltransferase [Anaerolineae bacterium]
MSSVVLKQGRAKPILRRHPWIFSGSIQRVEGDPQDGDIVDVLDAGRNWLARGYFNRHSQIRVRLLTWEEDCCIDQAFWDSRIEQAIAARGSLGLGAPALRQPDTTAYRLVHAESDYVPGLIVDRYADWLIVQFLTLGVDRQRDAILQSLVSSLEGDGIRGIYERSDVIVRAKEGLPQRVGLLWGEEPPETIEIRENGRQFLVDPWAGHKTGFYLDQRENRASLASCSAGADVLDAFCYTGGFAVYAATGGASRVTMVDSSGSSLELARRNLALNSSEPSGRVRDPTLLGRERQFEYVEDDVFAVLRRFRAEGRRFDVIILDPPKLAHSRGEVESASRAYKDINLLAFQLLEPGGVLFTFSCSGRVSADLFQKVVFGALADTDRKAQIISRLSQGPDHPVALTFPEGAYLKGLVCRVW